MFDGKTHYKWPFSIAMLVYQRVSHLVGGAMCHLEKYEFVNGKDYPIYI